LHWIWKHWPQPLSVSLLKNWFAGDKAAVEK
jgi:hypothetical protein